MQVIMCNRLNIKQKVFVDKVTANTVYLGVMNNSFVFGLGLCLSAGLKLKLHTVSAPDKEAQRFHSKKLALLIYRMSYRRENSDLKIEWKVTFRSFVNRTRLSRWENSSISGLSGAICSADRLFGLLQHEVTQKFIHEALDVDDKDMLSSGNSTSCSGTRHFF